MQTMLRAGSVGLLAVLAACGGSGGGGGAGGLTGQFHVVGLGGRFETVPVMESTFGRATADGATSKVAFDVSSNDEGTVTSGTETLPARLESDGTFALTTTGMGGPTDFLLGGLADDKSVVALGSVLTGSRPAIFVKVRTSAAAGAADLAGSYHVFLLRHETQVTGLVGKATFDGVSVGEILAGATLNQEGTVSAVALPIPLAYLVAADGGATLQGLGRDFQGGLRQGGDLLAVAGSVQNGGQPTLFVFLRAATSASVATFAGNYTLVSLHYSASTSSFTSDTGTAEADGAGTYSFSSTKNVEGVIGPSSGGNSYTVAPDGTLAIGATSGAVSPDGRFALLGGTGANTSPAINLLVRR